MPRRIARSGSCCKASAESAANNFAFIEGLESASLISVFPFSHACVLVGTYFERPLHNLLRGRILLLRLRLPCSLYSCTGALLETNFGRSLLCAEGSLIQKLVEHCCAFAVALDYVRITDSKARFLAFSLTLISPLERRCARLTPKWLDSHLPYSRQR